MLGLFVRARAVRLDCSRGLDNVKNKLKAKENKKNYGLKDSKLTGRKSAPPWVRFPSWCKHPGSWDPRTRLSQSDGWRARPPPVRWTHSPSCSRLRRSRDGFRLLSDSRTIGGGGVYREHGMWEDWGRWTEDEDDEEWKKREVRESLCFGYGVWEREVCVWRTLYYERGGWNVCNAK